MEVKKRPSLPSRQRDGPVSIVEGNYYSGDKQVINQATKANKFHDSFFTLSINKQSFHQGSFFHSMPFHVYIVSCLCFLGGSLSFLLLVF